jgi:hypothetical protein
MIYVEFFTPFTSSTIPKDGVPLPKISHSKIRGERAFAVLPIESIRLACHLIPDFKSLPGNVDLSERPDILEVSNKFYFNIFSSYIIFSYVMHWSKLT